MKTLTTIAEVRREIAAVGSGKKIALVPTMGNLHAGHLELVHQARKIADIVVVSIFVNPMQFGPKEDFAAYPRSLAEDTALLAAVPVDIIFAPTVHELYPEPQTFTVQPPEAIMNILEGAIRPGHFVGVATVVAKLFAIVGPHSAFFGQKDFQQLLIIKQMVRQLAMPIEMHSEPTVRAEDGLALSSRNRYLSKEQREQASELYAELQNFVGHISRSNVTVPMLVELESAAMNRLESKGWRCDYFTLRRQSDCLIPEPINGVINPRQQELVVLAAARLGTVRLLDNIPIQIAA